MHKSYALSSTKKNWVIAIYKFELSIQYDSKKHNFSLVMISKTESCVTYLLILLTSDLHVYGLIS